MTYRSDKLILFDLCRRQGSGSKQGSKYSSRKPYQSPQKRKIISPLPVFSLTFVQHLFFHFNFNFLSVFFLPFSFKSHPISHSPFIFAPPFPKRYRYLIFPLRNKGEQCIFNIYTVIHPRSKSNRKVPMLKDSDPQGGRGRIRTFGLGREPIPGWRRRPCPWRCLWAGPGSPGWRTCPELFGWASRQPSSLLVPSALQPKKGDSLMRYFNSWFFPQTSSCKGSDYSTSKNGH